MDARGIVAVVPMKPLEGAKSRLAAALSPDQRANLSLNMLGVVVRAALGSPADQIWVVGGDSAVREAAAHLGATWQDDTGVSLNDTLSCAFQMAFASDLTPMYIPADLPFVGPGDIGALVEVSGHGQALTLSPASRDGGTNAMIVPPGIAFRPALGVGSYQRHRGQAIALGAPPRVHDCPGMGLDLDTPEDLDAFEEMEPGFRSRLLAVPGAIPT